MAGRNKSDPFRLSALVRAAALYEGQNNIDKALAAYRDLMQNAQDPELVAAAEERVTNLQGSTP
jgi:predicted negative regulator of RcsB-dependent stress response